jgi:transketolase
MENKFMRDVFLENLYNEMKTNSKIFLVTADLGAPIIDKIKVDYKDRFLNVGIAEQNLINVSVGLALEGYIVYAYGITPFVTMRCFEQIRINISVLSHIKPLNINLIGVSTGVGYAMSGPTHHTLEDLSIINSLPNIEIFSPSDNMLVKEYVKNTISNNYPKYLRFDTTKNIPIEDKICYFENGFRSLKKSISSKVLIISTNFMIQKLINIVKDYDVELIDLYLTNKFNKELLIDIIENFNTIITVEEGFIGIGGLDSVINSLCKNMDINIINMGFEKKYTFEIGSREFVHQKNGLGKDDIIDVIQKALEC